jgi:uncharacterized protein
VRSRVREAEGEDAPERERCIPFTTYVVKVVSRCNLNCSYCYMYNLADQTYRGQPRFMSLETCSLMSERILSHARLHDVKAIHVILHGGEPLLLGKERTAEWVSTVRQVLHPEVLPHFSMQSNGVLIDDDWIDLLADLGVGIGISIDGPEAVHDRFRVYHDGRGSFDDVVKAIRRLQAHPRGGQIFGTVMAVIDIDTDPKDIWELWMFLGVPGFDLTLPHANHLNLPRQGKYSYGEWLIRFFDLWFDRNDPRLRVRFFENILRMLFGHPISTDNIGGRPVGVIVIETDGGIEPTDAFKCCEEGITKLGLNIHTSEIDDIYRFPMVRTLQQGRPSLCSTCRDCDIVEVCGGGYMPHRYRPDTQFQNPSAYCLDLYKLIRHVRNRIVEDIPPSLLQLIWDKPIGAAT